MKRVGANRSQHTEKVRILSDIFKMQVEVLDLPLCDNRTAKSVHKRPASPKNLTGKNETVFQNHSSHGTFLWQGEMIHFGLFGVLANCFRTAWQDEYCYYNLKSLTVGGVSKIQSCIWSCGTPWLAMDAPQSQVVGQVLRHHIIPESIM